MTGGGHTMTGTNQEHRLMSSPLWLSLSSVVQCQDQLLAGGLITWVFTALRALRILSVPDVTSPLYLHLWPPDYLCRILVLIETSSARPKPSNSELLTIKFRFPDVTEIGVSLLRCQCLAVASSHVNSQGSGGINFQIFGFPVPLLDMSGNNLIINISLIFPVSSSPTPGIGLLGYQCAVMWRIYPIVGFIVLLDCQFVFQLRQFCQQQQNKTILRTPKHQEKYRGCWGS